MDINTSMNLETQIFKKLKEFISDKSKFNPKVFNKIPRNLSVFPTIVFKEMNNVENISYTTLNRNETVNSITYQIELYTKDYTLEGINYPSKEVMNELKYLVFDFFQAYGFIRTQCTDAEYTDFTIDRLIIIETCNFNNWNRKINF